MLAGLLPGQLYFRAQLAIAALALGHNATAVLVYAKQIVGHVQWNPALFGYRMETGDDLTFDERDSAPFTFKSCVIDPAFTWGRARQPRIPWENTVIYEAQL